VFIRVHLWLLFFFRVKLPRMEAYELATIPRWVVSVLGAYFLGSIPFGYLVVKFGQGRDIRAAGSGNIGAANVTRTVGKGAGVLTLLLDAAKGWLAVWLAARLTENDITWMMGAALAAIVGHMFTVFLKFKGGKGVATGVGAFLPICWPAVLGALLVWVAVVGTWRIVSLGSMVASASLPILIYFLYDVPPGYAPPLVVTLGSAAAAVMIVLKHHENIARLAAGKEPRLKL
jgi:glycerol-3-phosphate acyltransferase PlsY